jgi:hypothetical protein
MLNYQAPPHPRNYHIPPTDIAHGLLCVSLPTSFIPPRLTHRTGNEFRPYVECQQQFRYPVRISFVPNSHETRG